MPTSEYNMSLLCVGRLRAPPNISYYRPLFLRVLVRLLAGLRGASLDLQVNFLAGFVLHLHLRSLDIRYLSLALFILQILASCSSAAFSSGGFTFFAG